MTDPTPKPKVIDIAALQAAANRTPNDANTLIDPAVNDGLIPRLDATGDGFGFPFGKRRPPEREEINHDA